MENRLAKTAGNGRLKGFLAVLFTIFIGLFFAWFKSMYMVDKGFEGLRIDMLSVYDSSAAGLENMKKESFSKAGHDTFVLWREGFEHTIPFTMEAPRTMRVRMSLYLPENRSGRPVKLYVNGVLTGEITPEWMGRFEKHSFDIPSDAVRKGVNTLSFVGGGVRVGYESIVARDIAGFNKRFPRAAVLFDENIPPGKRATRSPYDYALFPAAAFIIWILAINLARHNRSIEILLASKGFFVFYLPSVLLFVCCAFFSGLTRYDLMLYPDTFYIFAIAPGGIMLAKNVVAAVFFPRRGARREENAGIRPGKAVLKTFGFVYRNAGSIAVALFMVFLLLAGAFLIAGQQATADRLGDAAFFSLLFAVIVRTLDLRGEKEGGRV